MHVIVVGCGRVGSTVARSLASSGHDVVVIDRRPEAFRRLGDDFTGTTMIGVGFDRDVLAEAGITDRVRGRRQSPAATTPTSSSPESLGRRSV